MSISKSYKNAEVGCLNRTVNDTEMQIQGNITEKPLYTHSEWTYESNQCVQKDKEMGIDRKGCMVLV